MVLIRKGEETSAGAEIYSIGTTARVNDWENRADGLLGITAVGVDRFQVISTHTKPDGLAVAEIETLEEQRVQAIPEQFHYLLDLLEHVSAHEGRIRNPDQSFTEILYQLIYLLPLEIYLKQRLLEIPETADRAMILHAELIRLGIIQYVNPQAAED